MSSIAQAFSKAKAFIPFITCGDPNLAFSEKAIYTLAENGADIIELGIPFSDPMAEGGVIQKATARALESGTSVEDVFRLVAKVRTKSGVPLVLMTYANIVFSYGSKEFFAKARELGVNGVILPDVPYEEREEFARFAQGIDLIPLIAPTSNNRIAMLATNAQGFIYCVSSLGVTGVRENIPSNESIIARIKQASSTPVAVGFGISTPDQVREIARYADGVIIGSAVVSICALNESEEVRLQKLGAYAREIRAALDSVG